MTAYTYQRLASRTIDAEMTKKEKVLHALFGMAGEVGELHSLYQKEYQGHEFSDEHAQKEIGDLLWFIAEYCTANGWDLADIMELNINKLIKRYPNGFEKEKSLHREKGDI